MVTESSILKMGILMRDSTKKESFMEKVCFF